MLQNKKQFLASLRNAKGPGCTFHGFIFLELASHIFTVMRTGKQPVFLLFYLYSLWNINKRFFFEYAANFAFRAGFMF